MASSPLSHLLMNLPTFLWVLFYLGAIVAVAVKTTNAPSAKSRVVLGLVFHLLATVGGMFARFLVARFWIREDIMLAYSVVGIGTTVLHIIGTVLLISAAFAQRDVDYSYAPQPRGSFDDGNPYSPPVQ